MSRLSTSSIIDLLVTFQRLKNENRLLRQKVDQLECDVINMGGDGKLWS